MILKDTSFALWSNCGSCTVLALPPFLPWSCGLYAAWPVMYSMTPWYIARRGVLTLKSLCCIAWPCGARHDPVVYSKMRRSCMWSISHRNGGHLHNGTSQSIDYKTHNNALVTPTIAYMYSTYTHHTPYIPCAHPGLPCVVVADHNPQNTAPLSECGSLTADWVRLLV